MRSSDQISRTPEQYADFKAAERQASLRGLLANLRFARESEAEWYRWVVDGMPQLTTAEYDALKAGRRKRQKSK